MKIYSKPNNVQTSVPSEDSLSFGIGDESIVIEFLRNKIYSNKLKTSLQEYCCNSRDANRESGSKKPIHITIPSLENGFMFRVRDTGLGVSLERMEDVFVLYGKSTKRNDNTQCGMFGLGSKSAWSYCESFNITTHIRGVKRQYLALIDPSNKGRLDKTYEGPSDEPDGTEISYLIDQYDVNHAINAISDTVMYWRDEEYPTFSGPITALAQLKREREHYNVRFMGRNFNNVVNSRIGSNVIVVDGIPYKNPSRKFGTIFIPAGLVTFPITRESIENTPKNNKVIEEIEAEYHKEYIKAGHEWQNEIVDISTMYAAFEKQAGYSLSCKEINHLSIKNGFFSFKKFDNDNKYFEDIDVSELRDSGEKYFLLPGSRYTKKQLNSITNKIVITAKKLNKYKHWVDVGTHGEVKLVEQTYHKWEFDQELADKCVEIAKAHGFNKNLVEHVEKWKPVKKVSVAPADAFYYNEHGYQRFLNESDKDKTFIYYQGSEYENGWSRTASKFEIIKSRFKNHKVVRLTKKNLSKFKKDSRFISADEFFKSAIPTDYEVLMNLRSSSDYNNMLNRFDKLKKLEGSSNYRYNDTYMFLRQNPNYTKIFSETEIIKKFFYDNYVNIRCDNKKIVKEFEDWRYSKMDVNDLYKQIPTVLSILSKEK